jgi:hypothetical protein
MSAMPEATINTVIIFKAIVRFISIFGVWGWFDILGASILLFGCAGELWMLLNKLPEHNERRASLKGFWSFLDRAESSIRRIGVRLKIIRSRKFSELKEHLLEGFFISLVAIGVGMEMCSLPFSLYVSAQSNKAAGDAMKYAADSSSNSVQVLRQVAGLNKEAADARVIAGKANERAANTESNNLVLQSRVLELEAKAADRHISEKRIKDFIKSLGDTPRGGVFTGVRHPDYETLNYAAEVCSMLTNAGFTISSKQNFSEDVSPFYKNSDISIHIDKADDAPPYAFALGIAFFQAGFNPTIFTNQPGRFYTPNEGHPGSNEVLILVGEKPQ